MGFETGIVEGPMLDDEAVLVVGRLNLGVLLEVPAIAGELGHEVHRAAHRLVDLAAFLAELVAVGVGPPSPDNAELRGAHRPAFVVHLHHSPSTLVGQYSPLLFSRSGLWPWVWMSPAFSGMATGMGALGATVRAGNGGSGSMRSLGANPSAGARLGALALQA